MLAQGAGAPCSAPRSQEGTGFVMGVSSHGMEPLQPQLGWEQAAQAGQGQPGSSPSPLSKIQPYPSAGPQGLTTFAALLTET